MLLDAATTRAVLRSLHHDRRQRRVARLDWIDTIYKAYLTAILAGVAVVGLAAVVGGRKVSPSTLRDIVDMGPAALGVLVAVAVAVGLRSGSRGGPLALEAADVAHVLLAPVDRSTVLRGVALRQLRGVALMGLAGGAIAGILAAGRLSAGDPEDAVAWAASCAAAGFGTVVAAWGAALLASGRQFGRMAASGIGAALIAWSAIDLLAGTQISPMTWLGSCALAPLDVGLGVVIGPLAGIAVAALGLMVVGGTALEACERRASLVGQLRFAATVQDLRAVIVLHRQLSQERARGRPWIRLPSRNHSQHACWRRGWHGVMRWPAPRVGRVAILGACAGITTVAVWRGSFALIAVGGILIYVAALDAVEPFAAEVDRPDRSAAVPLQRGTLLLRNLAVPAVVMAGAGLVGLIAAVAMEPDLGVLVVGIATVVAAAVASSAAAALAVLLSDPSVTLTLQLTQPEVGSFGLLLRQIGPPLLAASALAPAIVAHQAARHGGAALSAGLGATLPALLLSSAVFTFVASRTSKPA